MAADQPQTSRIEVSKPAKPTFRDVRLEQGGQLRLTIVSLDGQQLPEQMVTVWFNKALVCQSKSNAKGQIRITGLRPGLHMIQIGESTQACRLWSAKSAPPNAIANPAFVAGSSTVRGQYSPMMPMIGPAALATGVTGVAIAAILIGKSSSDDNSTVFPASP